MRIPLFRAFNANTVYLIMSGGSALFLSMIFTVNMVYQKEVVGLNPLQLVLVGTMLESVVFVLEVPTGIVADLYSRRLSVIIGMVLIGAGFMVEGAIPHFGAVLLAQVLWGSGAAFTSGATEAWITDEVGQEYAGRVLMRGSQVGQLGGLAGIVISVALASAQITLPIVLGGALITGLGVLLILVMPENGFTPSPPETRNTWKQMSNTMRSGLRLARQRPTLITILAISAIDGLYSEGFDRLWTAHVLDNFTLPSLGQLHPIVWFGLIRAIGMILAIIVTEAARRRVDMTEDRAMIWGLLIVYSLMLIGIAVFGLAGHFGVALLAFWAVTGLRATNWPILTAWLNQHVESQVRATMISMASQLNAIGQIGGGPVVGIIGTAFSLRAALVTSALALSPALGLLGRLARQDRAAYRAAQPEATSQP